MAEESNSVTYEEGVDSDTLSISDDSYDGSDSEEYVNYLEGKLEEKLEIYNKLAAIERPSVDSQIFSTELPLLDLTEQELTSIHGDNPESKEVWQTQLTILTDWYHSKPVSILAVNGAIEYFGMIMVQIQDATIQEKVNGFLQLIQTRLAENKLSVKQPLPQENNDDDSSQNQANGVIHLSPEEVVINNSQKNRCVVGEKYKLSEHGYPECFFQGCKLMSQDISYAVLDKTDFSNSFFERSTLKKVSFKRTILEEADFTKAQNLKAMQLSKAFFTRVSAQDEATRQVLQNAIRIRTLKLCINRLKPNK